MQCRSQCIILHKPLVCEALSSTTVSIFLQLYLMSAGTFPSPDLFKVFVGRPLPLWPCGINCSTCLAMLSSLRLSVSPIKLHFLLLSCSKTGSRQELECTCKERYERIRASSSVSAAATDILISVSSEVTLLAT